MILVKCKEFNYRQIADSGQAFRMGPDGFCIAGSRCCKVKENSEAKGYIIDCPDKDNEFWKEYFDLKTDYSAYIRSIDPKDDYLCHAAAFGEGIRILKQDPWEMLITFIISQRKNIPAIKSSVERLCERWGTRKKNYYAFPTPQQLASANLEELRDCGLGYRDEYIFNAAHFVLDNPSFLENLEGKSYDEIMESLMKLKGVGVKVANCVALFGYHKIDAFPIDVWISRVLETHYKEGFPFDRYEGFSGIMQQYIFFYVRNMADK